MISSTAAPMQLPRSAASRRLGVAAWVWCCCVRVVMSGLLAGRVGVDAAHAPAVSYRLPGVTVATGAGVLPTGLRRRIGSWRLLIVSLPMVAAGLRVGWRRWGWVVHQGCRR